uniref:Uncharacterized protein n=1 Tax=Opuntia streptacantha TaxID=393608 RepID=A0A7C9EHC4_OPUST
MRLPTHDSVIIYTLRQHLQSLLTPASRPPRPRWRVHRPIPIHSWSRTLLGPAIRVPPSLHRRLLVGSRRRWRPIIPLHRQTPISRRRPVSRRSDPGPTRLQIH